jgi:hypothetical protein
MNETYPSPSHVKRFVKLVRGVFARKPLIYAATAQCDCGARLAYMDGEMASWDCSDILLGRAVPAGQEGAVRHSARLPFEFSNIERESDPGNRGSSTLRSDH